MSISEALPASKRSPVRPPRYPLASDEAYFDSGDSTDVNHKEEHQDR